MDREKVIEGLRICASGCREGCPKLDSNNNGRTCFDALMTDAAELLEEQETIIRCCECKYYSGANDNDGYFTAIGYCDHPRHHIMPMRYDFWCADAKRR